MTDLRVLTAARNPPRRDPHIPYAEDGRPNLIDWDEDWNRKTVLQNLTKYLVATWGASHYGLLVHLILTINQLRLMRNEEIVL